MTNSPSYKWQFVPVSFLTWIVHNKKPTKKSQCRFNVRFTLDGAFSVYEALKILSTKPRQFAKRNWKKTFLSDRICFSIDTCGQIAMLRVALLPSQFKLKILCLKINFIIKPNILPWGTMYSSTRIHSTFHRPLKIILNSFVKLLKEIIQIHKHEWIFLLRLYNFLIIKNYKKYENT